MKKVSYSIDNEKWWIYNKCEKSFIFKRKDWYKAMEKIVELKNVSKVYKIGDNEFKALDNIDLSLNKGEMIVILGPSGAGKSTLLNAICGEEIMKTSAIRESDDTGRHTTTYRQLIELQNGAFIIDTPGMREIGMAMVDEGIDNTFSDIVELENRCKYSNCRHDTEPGCAVKLAIESGELSMERFMLYQSLGQENTNNYAKKNT